jgi:mRNA-degrading endonuclease toxin of MazEF toxin-antitoxin module
MIDCDRWDVITALFPFVELPIRKPRPVLVLSRRAFNMAHAHVIGCMITTGAGTHWPSDCPIRDLRTAGLSHRSVVRWKVFTLPAALIGRRIGALSADDRVTMDVSVAAVIG